MEAAILSTASSVADAQQFVQYDLAFHGALTTATHNNIYAVLLSPITDLLLDFRLTAYQFDRQEAINGSLMYHRLILAQVKTRDAEGARRAMRKHLDQAESLFLAARRQAGVQ
jgi:GntR family transcriptional repressor for pyruvate dehydrogenase complex